MSEQEITNDELARMIKDQFDATGKRFDSLEKEIGQVKTDVGTLKADVGTLKIDVAYLKSQMVTKEYLDDKLSDQYGDIVVLFRKGDKQFSELVSILLEKAVLSVTDLKRLEKLRPLVMVE